MRTEDPTEGVSGSNPNMVRDKVMHKEGFARPRTWRDSTDGVSWRSPQSLQLYPSHNIYFCYLVYIAFIVVVLTSIGGGPFFCFICLLTVSSP